MSTEFTDLFGNVFSLVSFLTQSAFVWVPAILAIVFIKTWLKYKRTKWISNINWVMLEIKMTRDVSRPPLAMEIVLNSIYQAQSGTKLDRLLKGRVKNWFSLEMVSLGGDVRFFIRTNVQYKDVVEAQIYSQYPSAEVHEVPDYTRYVDYHGKGSEWDIWGLELKLAKKDAYPIKTYIDYGLDKTSEKEEFKVDPITSVIEYLGSMTKDEQAWVQILAKPTIKRLQTPGKWFKKRDWNEEGKYLTEKIIKDARKRSGDNPNAPVRLTKGEEDAIEAIERNISKLGFDCGVRGIYLFRKDAFRLSNIFGLAGVFRAFDSNELNSFKISNPTNIDYPWQDFNKIRITKMKTAIFDAYRRRAYFYHPYKKKPFVLNTEELATVFHFPGAVAETPTFGRIESRKGEPPAGLPL